jgi:polyisoprenoid-binding protein YceI
MMRVVRFAALTALLAVPAQAPAAERTVTLDTAASQVSFTLDTTFHEVHGTVPLVGGEIRFDPATGAASGEIVVDGTQAKTGNDKRDRKMHEEVLETERFPRITFRLERVEGPIAASGPSTIRISGVLTLHGADHPMTLEAKLEANGDRVSGSLEMQVPYVEWGMKDPSFLVARAAKTVVVKVQAEGRWVDAVAAAR